MSPNLALSAIGQIHISVEDIARAVAFYRDVLGLKLLFEVPGQPMAFFDCGGVRLYLGVPERPEFRSHPLLYYRVEQLEPACAALRARGVELDSEPHLVHRAQDHELWMAGFRDPEGNHLMLMSEVPTS
jgi:catechol 2,3-dioxygenase-like lactoylglutathione lyase family enzyme